MSKYSKSYIKEQIKEFTPKELQAFKRLVQEYNYTVERAFEKIMTLKMRQEQSGTAPTAPETPRRIENPLEEEKLELIPEEEKLELEPKVELEAAPEVESIVTNEGGQNVIKPVDESEFELIEIKDDDEPIDNSKITKDFPEDEIIPVLSAQEVEADSLNWKLRETYDRFIKNGYKHEEALREAYLQDKEASIKKVESLEVFYNFDE